jgi:hypothetical protein
MKERNINKIFGILIIVLGLIIWSFRPLQSCSWWNLLCHAASPFVTAIFLAITGLLIIIGIIKLLK